MGIFLGFLKSVGKNEIFRKYIVICNFSGYKGELSDIETLGLFYRYHK